MSRNVKRRIEGLAYLKSQGTLTITVFNDLIGGDSWKGQQVINKKEIMLKLTYEVLTDVFKIVPL